MARLRIADSVLLQRGKFHLAKQPDKAEAWERKANSLHMKSLPISSGQWRSKGYASGGEGDSTFSERVRGQTR